MKAALLALAMLLGGTSDGGTSDGGITKDAGVSDGGAVVKDAGTFTPYFDTTTISYSAAMNFLPDGGIQYTVFGTVRLVMSDGGTMVWSMPQPVTFTGSLDKSNPAGLLQAANGL